MREEIKSHLPQFYNDIRDFQELINVEATELANADELMEGVVSQLFVETATWGLKHWEKIFSISTDESKPLNQRRSVIKAKIRGAGVTTVDLVKQVAESWYNGEIEVIEEPEKVGIKFNSNYGIPSNLGDVEKALREIIPAHLIIEFLFSYLTVADVNAMTISEMNNTLLSNFAGGA